MLLHVNAFAIKFIDSQMEILMNKCGIKITNMQGIKLAITDFYRNAKLSSSCVTLY